MKNILSFVYINLNNFDFSILGDCNTKDKLIQLMINQYSNDTSNFNDEGTCAYMDINISNNGNKLYAYFEPNTLNRKWKWKFCGIKTDDEIRNMGLNPKNDSETLSSGNSEVEKSCRPVIKKAKKVIKLNTNNDSEKKKEISSFDMVDVPGNKNIKPFKMAKYVVVQKLYNEVMGKNPSHFVKNGDEDKMPVESVSLEDVILFCNELSKQKDLQVVYSLSDKGWVMNSEANGYRLPTEEEWHLAANEGKSKGDYPYSGSENIQKVAWWQGDNPESTHFVGDDRKLPNKLGLYDMSGNVWEWCWDYDGNERICCGGAYNSSEEEITLTSIKNIKKVNPYAKDHTIGFRLVQTK